MAQTKKMVEEIIKEAMYQHPNAKALHGVWFEGNYQCCSDSYRAVCLYKPIEVAEREEGTFTVTRLFIDAELHCTEEVELPPVKEIREQIKNLIGRSYKSNRVLYRLGDNPNLATVNAKYLVECMECIGATSLKYNPKNPKKDLLLMETDLGKVVLSPVYNTSEQIGYWTTGC